MTNIRGWICILLALMIMCAAQAFAQSELEIRGLSEYIAAGKEYKLTAYKDGKSAAAYWKSSNPRAASVTNAGAMRAYTVSEPVSVTITAEAGGASASYTFTVVPDAKSAKLYHNGALCSAKTIVADIAPGEAVLELSCLVEPEGAGAGVKWTSSDERVASVDDNGRVTVREAGEATIRASCVNGRYTSCTIKACYAISELAISYPDELPVGAKQAARVDIKPAISGTEPLRWSSSNPQAVKVDQQGTLTAVKPGVSVITASADSGATAEYRVEAYAPVYGVSLTTKQLSLIQGTTARINANVYPKDAKYQALTYESSDPGIASVDANGVVSALGEGTAQITISAEGGKQAVARVHVRFVPLKTAEYTIYRMAMNAGETRAPGIVLAPDNASTRDVEYSSDCPEVASVDARGVITAVSAGRAVISVKPLGAQEATGRLNVRVLAQDAPPLAGVKIGINPGHQIGLDLTQLPIAPGSNKTGNANSGYAVGIVTYNREYEVNLDISLMLRDILEEMGAEVVMTRTTHDVKINNIERAKMLNEARVDVALQIHCNNNPKSEYTQGASAYVKSRNSESFEIAQMVLDELCASSGAKNKAVRIYGGYMSLNWSETPTLLLECGYMSNREEDVKLGDPEYQMLIAQGIANGLMEYYTSDHTENQ